MSSYTPIFKPFTTRPTSQYHNGNFIRNLALVRDHFSIVSWLLIGALLQGLLTLLPYRNIALVTPALLLITLRVASPILMTFGIIPNTYMKGVIPGRTIPLFPSEASTAPAARSAPAQKEICVMILGARCNHPMGIFAPGYKEVGDMFQAMSAELDANAEKYGYLGQSAWMGAGDGRQSKGEIMSILYFSSSEGIYDYAHGPLHTQSMLWWTGRGYKHIGLMHEVFVAPKGSWEGVYTNYHQTGLGAATMPAIDEAGEKVWVNPLVEGRGKMAWSKARMGRQFKEKEWAAFEDKLNGSAMYGMQKEKTEMQ